MLDNNIDKFKFGLGAFLIMDGIRRFSTEKKKASIEIGLGITSIALSMLKTSFGPASEGAIAFQKIGSWDCSTESEYPISGRVCKAWIDYPKIPDPNQFVREIEGEFLSFFDSLQKQEIAVWGSTFNDWENHRTHFQIGVFGTKVFKGNYEMLQ